MIMKSAVVAGVAMLAVTTMLAKNNGQPVHTIRFTYKVAFTNAGAVSTNSANPSGSATATESINNTSDRESLNITLKGLVPSGSYGLSATVGTSNGIVGTFTANKSGAAKVTVSTKAGKTGIAIGALDPLTGVTELDVDEVDSNGAPTAVILVADTTTPQSFTFQDKLSETGTNGETGTLTVSASTKSSKVSLTASGLADSNPYTLALTGGTITSSNTTFTSTSKGTLKLSAPISANVLDLTEVDLLDAANGNATVLTFPLP